MPLISAYRTDTGEKVTIPADWVDHPVLGAPFSKTSRQKAADAKADKPATTPTTPAKSPAAGAKKED